MNSGKVRGSHKDDSKKGRPSKSTYSKDSSEPYKGKKSEPYKGKKSEPYKGKKKDESFDAKKSEPYKGKRSEPYKGKRSEAYKGKKLEPYKGKKKEVIVPVDPSIRLNRYLANAGICSRREADVIIQSGSVMINNEVVTTLGTKVQPGDTVHYGGEKISGEAKRYLLLNKPKDYITTMDDPQKRRTVMDLVGRACKERIYPVGRLDRATSGLLLFTNDGYMAKSLTHPSSKVTKTYHVHLDKSVTKNHLIQLVEGVQLEDGIGSADKAFYQGGIDDKSRVVLELHSGKNRIIRRMLEALGYKVLGLDRTIFATLTKKNLPRGKFRFLEESEIGLLHKIAGLK